VALRQTWLTGREAADVLSGHPQGLPNRYTLWASEMQSHCLLTNMRERSNIAFEHGCSPASGDKAADDGFEAFVRQTARELRGHAALVLGSDLRADAEDLVQETLTIMYRNWPRIADRDAGARAFAHKTLVRLARKHARRTRSERHRTISGQFEANAMVRLETGRNDDSQLLFAMSNLPFRQRETLTLRFYLDLSVEETGRLMRCTQSTVKSQTAKGLENLRALVAENAIPKEERRRE